MIEGYAKKTFLALLNPYDTVMKTWPGIIDEVKPSVEKQGYAYYIGYKDTETIPESLIRHFRQHGFLKHTRDRMALGGRAVDLRLINPLTGRWMSGSSSGTALNVFYGINDIGVGTDGGGSVLAPAAALNLYGFISPLIEAEYLKCFEKKSTDGISFTPSIGFISRDLDIMKTAVGVGTSFLNTGEADSKGMSEFINVSETIDIYGSRKELIPYVKETVKRGTILVSEEGPVDLLGMGDSVFGHFDEETRELQKLGKKGLMRIANMCGLTAMAVPQKSLGRCKVYLCDSNPGDVSAVFSAALQGSVPASPLVEKYFLDQDMYF